MSNMPHLFLSDRKCGNYSYHSIKYDEYGHLDDKYSEDAIAIIFGLQKSAPPIFADFVDAKESYLIRKNIQDDEQKRSFLALFDEHIIRKMWAKETGVEVELSTLTDYSALINALLIGEKISSTTQLNYKKNMDEIKMELRAFCQKYGLPAFYSSLFQSDSLYSTRDADVLLRDGTRIIHSLNGVSTSEMLPYAIEYSYLSFLFWRLYHIYLAWSCFYCDDEDAGRILYEHYKNKELQVNSIHDACKFCLKTYSQELSVQKSLGFDRNSIPQATYTSANIMEALRLQLIDIFIAGDDWLDGRSLYRCKRCDKEFVRTHASATLCENCRTGASRVRAHRAKKRIEEESVKNGKETR